ncbi:MAG TPA: DNA polymerase III subunit gamma/tau [Alcaligenes sp.]|nr:DNA polymerase III subunit gamma/tau [Alcaligenes sp.]HRL28386.1 DNA polymerase III subunit gamma/tau [Alcaligenes sp.]
MTYLVLARKWRPRSFDTLIGQDHVVRALTHALSTQRLHHAWLFTGTRGVGKTTLSRILAKSLNCETGITATPCGVCRACTEIDAGRFVDYVELDAASNRGVEEMTQLLEQAVYAPSSGRYKVYMIDEVHMLTGHAFNAMLKTLEEPPAHVKFILATTDPQKIPVTVLSRCLQFNLKQMTVPAIVEHLQDILAQEGMQFEVPALRLLAQAAAGSMRDALSLTDQAIAYSAGDLSAQAVQAMLGTIDQRHLAQLLQALVAYDAKAVLAVADDLALRGLSYAGALADLATLLSRIAIEQRIAGTISDDDPLAEPVRQLAPTLSPDHVQLFYSVAVHSRQELTLAPDEYAGFVMACLRMLALLPEPVPAQPVPPTGSGSAQAQPVQAASRPEPAKSTAPAAPVAEAVSTAPAPPTAAKAQVAAAVPASAPASVASDAVQTLASEARGTDERSPVADNFVPAWEDAPSSSAPMPEPAASAPLSEQTASPPSAPGVIATEVVAEPTAPLAPVSELASQVPAESVSVADDGPQEPAWLSEGMDEEFENYQPAGMDAASGGEDDGDVPPLPASGNFMPDGELGLPIVESAAAHGRDAGKAVRLGGMTADKWPTIAAALPLSGWAAELARQSEWVSVQGQEIYLRAKIKAVDGSQGKARLRTVLTEYFGQSVQLAIEYGDTGDATAHAVEQAKLAERQRQAEERVAQDPFVLTLIREFGASVKEGSVKATPLVRVA